MDPATAPSLHGSVLPYVGKDLMMDATAIRLHVIRRLCALDNYLLHQHQQHQHQHQQQQQQQQGQSCTTVVSQTATPSPNDSSTVAFTTLLPNSHSMADEDIAQNLINRTLGIFAAKPRGIV